MTVYVDDFYKSAMGVLKRGPHTYKMSHMIGDDLDELHAMAVRLEVRSYFQGDHYDISMTKRALALLHGAKEISFRECAAMRWLHNRRLGMGDPRSAVQRMVNEKKKLKIALD